MTEPEQIRIKDAAIMMQYSEATIYRLIKRGILPTRGRGQLLRIPVAAIREKMSRMEQGEDLWHGARETTAAVASVEQVRPGSIRPVKRGMPTKMSTGGNIDIGRLVAKPPKSR